MYERFNSSTAYVSISDSDRHPRLTYAATIHHGIDVEAFELHGVPGDHLLFFGRIHPDKGTAHAIEVARMAGRRLIIAGIVQDEDYFRTEVEPHVDGDRVRFVGAVRAHLLGKGLVRAQRVTAVMDRSASRSVSNVRFGGDRSGTCRGGRHRGRAVGSSTRSPDS